MSSGREGAGCDGGTDSDRGDDEDGGGALSPSLFYKLWPELRPSLFPAVFGDVCYYNRTHCTGEEGEAAQVRGCSEPPSWAGAGSRAGTAPQACAAGHAEKQCTTGDWGSPYLPGPAFFNIVLF